MTLRKAMLPALALVALIAAVSAVAAPTRSVATTTVSVAMTEFKFVLSRKTVPKGTLVFKLANKGKLDHDLKIVGKRSPVIKPGRAGTFRVVIAKAGRYPYLCTIKGHSIAGMKGVLVVK